MNMTLRTKLFILIGLGLLFIVGVSFWLYSRSRPKSAPDNVAIVSTTNNIVDNTNIGQTNFNPQPTGITSPPGAVSTPLAVEQNSVRQQAKIFVERIGSYSSESNFQNVVEVKALVTAGLWQRIGKQPSANPGATGPYQGATTEALSTELSGAWNPPQATVTIQARQTTSKNGASTVAYRNATVVLVKADGKWLVDSYQWEK